MKLLKAFILTGICSFSFAGGFNGTSGSAGVSSINSSGNSGITGPATIAGGTNITLAQSGSTITVNSSGGSGQPIYPSTGTPTFPYGVNTSSITATIFSSAPIMYTPVVSNYPNSTWNLQLYNGLVLNNTLTVSDSYIGGSILSFGGISSGGTSIQRASGISDGTGSSTDDTLTFNFPHIGTHGDFGFFASASSAFAITVSTPSGPNLISVSTGGVLSA